MKTLKKAEQQNVVLKKNYYNEKQLNDIRQKEYAFTLKYDNDCIRISLNYAKEIAERFCDGALMGFFKDGSIKKWLTRLLEIDGGNN